MSSIVFLHGFTGVPGNFNAISRGLSEPKLVLAPALLGHLDGPQYGESFASEVARLAQLIAQRATSPAVLVGYSLGARLALGIATHSPALVRALILISVNPGLRTASERAARVASDEELARFVEQHGTQAFVAQRWETQPLFRSQRSLPDAVLNEQRQQRHQHEAAGLAHCLRVLGLGMMPNYWDELAHVANQVPTTLLTGTSDEKFHALAAEICECSPKIAWLSAPDVGHNLLLEAPELVLRIVQHVLHST